MGTVPDDLFMVRLGAFVGLVMGIIAIFMGAEWWVLPALVALNALLAVAA